MRRASLSTSVAASVDAPGVLRPVLGELFRGIDSLGSSPGEMVRLLRGAGVRRGDRVLDLACGKGAVAVAAARGIGCRVLGVDGAEEFVESARALARRRGVEGSARFECGDVRTLRGVGRGFEAAMMIGLLPLAEAARLLRARTRRGGIYLIDDCFVDPRRGRVPRELRGVPTMEESCAMVAAIGDRVERVAVPTPSAVDRMHGRLLKRLTAAAAAVGRERPELRPALREFVGRQRAGHRMLVGVLRPAVWVLRRA